LQLEEDHGKIGECHLGFDSVFAVVQSDGEEARRVGERGVQAYLVEFVASIGTGLADSGDARADYGESISIACSREVDYQVVFFKQCAGTDFAIGGGKRYKFHATLLCGKE
jgi:hypothetical protein